MLTRPTLILAFVLIAASGPLLSDTPTARPDDILAFLNQSIVWHRQLSAQEQLVREPSDAVFLNDNRQIADQVIRLSFEFARTEAQQIALQGSAANAAGNSAQPPASQYQNLVSMLEKSNQSVSHVQKEIASFKSQIATAAGKKRALLESQLAETESELALLQVRRDAVQNLLEFASGVSSSSAGAGGLHAQIEELARTVPAVASQAAKPAAGNTAPAATSTPVAVATSNDSKDAPTGIFGLIADVLDLRRRLGLLDDSLRLTDSLSQASRTLRAPMVAGIREFARRGDELVSQPDSQDPAILAAQKKELEGLTAQFKQLSQVVVPLGKQNILFDLYKKNVTNWRNVVAGEYSARRNSLLFRLSMLASVLVLIFGASEIWRRATFRYISDLRRRHQFLLLRRIIVWPLVAVIVIVAFANGLGSITTFAGLLTAGMAVALQNLILSVVGYFFLIGKYGVRVGDRVQVGGISGNVVDIGLVRMHVMEISGGAASRPTGRLVAISNAVVFQPENGLFKQIPGTNFVWHEVSLTLAPESDYRQVEERMLLAVNKIFADYREKMEQQRGAMERAINVLNINSLQPESRLRLTEAGLQVIIRYPAEMENAAEVDDRVTREVLEATGREPKLRIIEPPSQSSPSDEQLTAIKNLDVET